MADSVDLPFIYGISSFIGNIAQWLEIYFGAQIPLDFETFCVL